MNKTITSQQAKDILKKRLTQKGNFEALERLSKK